ncbi:hypothetical protein PT974_07775 [Cladobotryum mycophilum]|uniref:Zn(2)-C6 fungal-type domain-containing protein n=1 Tax=Cladobotryum mycophilum TaxID=491253 RepID=A0ABR0SIS2_9HYPO
MENPQRSTERLLGAAAVACVSCRKLKMRCIGAADPPCARCLKRNRECVVRLPKRQQQHRVSHSKAPVDGPGSLSPNPLAESRPSPVVSHSSTSSVQLVETTSLAQEPSHRPSSKQQNSPLQEMILPSIFSSSPMTIAKRGSPSSGAPASHNVLGIDQVPDSTILDLVEFFLQKSICYVPVLSLEPLDNIERLVTNRRPLAYAMAFVASTLSPGYSSTHLALFPYMSKMLEQANGILNEGEEENWTLMQALAVLYAYPRVTAVSGQMGERFLSPWAVKSAVETCAMQISLHESIKDLNALIKSGEPDISSSPPYRRAFYWIWLFVKSRHHSVMTRSPPTIHDDSTVASTLDLLVQLDPQPGVWRVLAEAALHRLWDQAARSDKSLAEWWCIPPDTRDTGSLLELLEKAENMLQEWSSTWLQSNDMSTPSSLDSSLLDPTIFANVITSFMGVLTRFIIVSFAAPIISHQLIAKTGLATFSSTDTLSPELSAFLNCVLKSADAASKCCDMIINLKPAAREVLRYTPDYGFTMLALCCLHLVYAYTMSPGTPLLKSYLVKAEKVAYLMMDLRVGLNVCPKVYGEYVLGQLRNATQRCHEDQIMTNSQQDPAIGDKDFRVWPQVASMAGWNIPPLDSLFHDGLANDSWPGMELSCDVPLPSNPDLLDMLNIYPDSLLHSNTN